MATQTLDLLPAQLVIVRLPPTSPMPEWLPDEGFVSVTRTAAELSIVCRADAVAATLAADVSVATEAGWRALALRGPFEFSLTGILSSVLVPLADAGVGIFALSTFDTDYVLVKEAQLENAVASLRGAGHLVHT